MYADGTRFHGSFAERVGDPAAVHHSWSSQSTIVLSTQDDKMYTEVEDVLDGIITTIEEFSLDTNELDYTIFGENQIDTDTDMCID